LLLLEGERWLHGLLLLQVETRGHGWEGLLGVLRVFLRESLVDELVQVLDELLLGRLIHVHLVHEFLLGRRSFVPSLRLTWLKARLILLQSGRELRVESLKTFSLCLILLVLSFRRSEERLHMGSWGSS